MGGVLALCRHLLGSREAAEDATSEVFLKAQRANDTYDATMPFGRWVLGIARNHCLDVLRRRRLEGRIFANAGEQDSADSRAGPLTRLLCRERRDTVQAAIAGLPESYRVPLILRYYEELTYDEIADALDLARQNVATLLFRAKKRLRRILSAADTGGFHGLLL